MLAQYFQVLLKLNLTRVLALGAHILNLTKSPVVFYILTFSVQNQTPGGLCQVRAQFLLSKYHTLTLHLHEGCIQKLRLFSTFFFYPRLSRNVKFAVTLIILKWIECFE